jgi:predicted RNase H-like HicB family nuclease
MRDAERVLGSARAMELPVILSPGEDGYLVAECPVIPGCISQGRTRAEALRNIREAIELCLEGQAEEGWRLPTRYEMVRVPVAKIRTPGRSLGRPGRVSSVLRRGDGGTPQTRHRRVKDK